MTTKTLTVTKQFLKKRNACRVREAIAAAIKVSNHDTAKNRSAAESAARSAESAARSAWSAAGLAARSAAKKEIEAKFKKIVKELEPYYKNRWA